MNSYPSLRTNLECDVLIVGGGITGSLMAHQCVEEGYKTVLIDKREVAHGSSAATTSLLQYEIDVPLYQLMEQIGEIGALESYRSCYQAIDDLALLCHQIGSQAGFKKKNSLYYAVHRKDLRWLRKEYRARKEAGFDVSWWNPTKIKAEYGIRNAYGGIFSKQGASVDAFKLVHEILDYNVNRGLEVYDRTTLSAVSNKTNGHEVKTDTGVIIYADKIVYCVGYESVDMIKDDFVELVSTFAWVSEKQPHDTKRYDDLLIWNTANPYLYFRTTDDGRFLVGGEDEVFDNAELRDASLPTKVKKLQKSVDKMLDAVPIYIDFSWAGTFGKTKDGLPYIGEHKDFKNSYFVLGFGGNGITFSVTGMRLLSDWLKSEKHPLSEWFRFGR